MCVQQERRMGTWVSVCVSVPFIIYVQRLSNVGPPISWAFVWPVCHTGHKKKEYG